MNNLLFNISFHVQHQSLAALNIISEFDLTPRFFHSVGEARKTPKGTPLEGIYAETYCSFLLEKKVAGHLDEYLEHWRDYLEKHAEFLNGLLTSGGKLEFYVSIFLDGDKGFEIKNSQLKRIYALGLGLTVEMYRLSDEEAANSGGPGSLGTG